MSSAPHAPLHAQIQAPVRHMVLRQHAILPSLQVPTLSDAALCVPTSVSPCGTCCRARVAQGMGKRIIAALTRHITVASSTSSARARQTNDAIYNVLAVATAALAGGWAGDVCLPTACVCSRMPSGGGLLSALPRAGQRAGRGNGRAGATSSRAAGTDLPILAAPLQRLVLLRVLRHVTHDAAAAPMGEQGAEEQEMLAYLNALRQAAGEGDVAGSNAPPTERPAAVASARDYGGSGAVLVVAAEEVEVLQRWTEDLTDAFRYYPGGHTAATSHGSSAGGHVAGGHVPGMTADSRSNPPLTCATAAQSLDVAHLLPPGLTMLQRQGAQTVGGGPEGHCPRQMSSRVGYLSSACCVAELVCPPVCI